MDLMTYLLCKRDGGGGGSGTTYTIATEGRKVTLTDADGNKQEITVPYATTAYSAQKIDGKDVPTLDNAGKIPTDYLPSYVDDVEEYPSIQAFPQTGEAGKVYVDTSSDKIYRWTGSQYVDITGGLPHCYDQLTDFLENENIIFSKDETTDYNSFALNFIDLVLTGYADIAVDRDGGVNTWGDTGNSGLVGAVEDICTRIAALEESGGDMPESYSGLTEELGEDGHIRFGTNDPDYELASMLFTGYHPTVYFDQQSHIYSADGWGDTDEDDLFRAVGDMCDRIAALEGGSLPDCYEDLTSRLENGDIIFGINESTDQPALTLTGYTDIVVDREGGEISWGDTGNSGLFDAINNICNRLPSLEDGSLIYDDTPVIHNYHSDLMMTGYSDIILESEYNSIYLGNERTWGDTENSDLFNAIDNMCDRIVDLEQGGGSNVADVYVNGVSVLDANNIAQLKGYVEVTQAEYDALPASKLTDGIPYYITDSKTGITDVKVNGVSVIDNNGVANITVTDENVKRTSQDNKNHDRSVLLGSSSEGVGGVYTTSYLEFNPHNGNSPELIVHNKSDATYNKRAKIEPDFMSVQSDDSSASGGAQFGFLVTNSGANTAMAVRDNDIEIRTYQAGTTSVNQTWDGTNTSLKNAISDIKTEIGSISDTKVKQESSGSSTYGNYRVLLSKSDNDTEETDTVYKGKGLTYNPSSGKLELILAPNTGMYFSAYDGEIVTSSQINNSSRSISINGDDIKLSGSGNTWDGTNKSLKAAISDLSTNISNIEDDIIYRDQNLFTYSNIPGDQEMTLNNPITAIQGYTPIGIINQKITSNDILEVANKILFMYIYLDNNTINYGIRNRIDTTLEGTFNVSARVLYKKTTS